MDSRHRVELLLELDIDADPIAGLVRHGNGAPRPFTGWLGLTAALEGVLGQTPQARGGGAGSLPAPIEDQAARAKDT